MLCFSSYSVVGEVRPVNRVFGILSEQNNFRQKEEPEELSPADRLRTQCTPARRWPAYPRVILLGIYTGARIGPSELFSLKWDDVDLTRGVIGIRLVGQILNARHGRKSQLKTKPLPGSI